MKEYQAATRAETITGKIVSGARKVSDQMWFIVVPDDWVMLNQSELEDARQ